MKEKYDGYPKYTVKNPVRHSDLALDEEAYIHEFNTSKEFHVKRIKKGKEIRNLTIGKAALGTVIAGGLALGALIHGNNLISSISDLMTIYSRDVYAISIALGAFIPISKETIEVYKKLGRIQTDLNVSKEMIQSFEDKEIKGRAK